ncbi:MAG: methyl-accepting chemotaxis protein, partial [Treponema sp.]|nr:methyl-accepting chemotaxis protein [Treponema sp.]
MKIKFKLSLIVIVIMAVAITGVAGILLWQSSGKIERLSVQNIGYLGKEQAQYWKGREEGFLQMLRGIANIMSQYESVPADQRRDRYDDMLRATLINNTNFVRIFSIWKPNALDGMDSRFIGRPGSTTTGQYAMTWGRDTGQIVVTPNLVLNEVTAWLNGPNAKKDRIENPMPFKVEGKDTFIVRMGVPIINPRTSEVVGNVTCLINLAPVQATVEELIGEHNEIAAMSIYSDNGFIMGNIVPDRIGKLLPEAETVYGAYVQDVNRAVLEGKRFQCSSYSPLLKTNLEIILIPFQIGNSDTTWSIMIASAESYILKDVQVMILFTVIIAAIAIIISSVIVYFVLGSFTMPIVRVADVLKNVADGDLTKSVNVNTKDEIGDLAHDFNFTMGKIRHLVSSIKYKINGLNHTSFELSVNMGKTSTAVQQISSNLDTMENL